MHQVILNYTEKMRFFPNHPLNRKIKHNTVTEDRFARYIWNIRVLLFRLFYRVLYLLSLVVDVWWLSVPFIALSYLFTLCSVWLQLLFPLSFCRLFFGLSVHRFCSAEVTCGWWFCLRIVCSVLSLLHLVEVEVGTFELATGIWYITTYRKKNNVMRFFCISSVEKEDLDIDGELWWPL